MKSHLFITILIYTANCEWIEITPIENTKHVSRGKNVSVTTTENYESIMRSPFTRPEIITTTSAYSTNEENFKHITNPLKDSIKGKTRTTQTPSPNIASREYLNSSDDYPNHDQKDTVSNEGFLPFLKTIQMGLLKFKKTHKSKMSVLKNLRDHLLVNIKQLITNLWKPKVSAEARGYHDDDDTHMDFPSNEGALMTIGFLTFAVFLIKLVIKLIHALKYKQQYYGTTTTTTAASVVFLKRKRRDEEEQEMNKILQYIEEF